MSLIREIVGIFVPRILTENIIKANEDSYYNLRKKFPGKNEHDYLAMTYAARRKAGAVVRNDSITEEQIELLAYTETQLFAVLKPPNSIRALALYILYKERPDLLTDSYSNEYTNLVEPILKSQDDGTFWKWYEKTNPDFRTKNHEQKPNSYWINDKIY